MWSVTYRGQHHIDRISTENNPRVVTIDGSPKSHYDHDNSILTLFTIITVED